MSWNSIPFISFLFLVAMLAVRIRILKKKGIQPGSGNQERNRSKTTLIPVFLLVFLLWLFEIVRQAFHFEFSLLAHGTSDLLIICQKLQIVGGVSILFSLFVFILTLKAVGNSLRFGLDKNNQGALVTSGIFALSRNPFFLSLDLFFLGTAMILPSVFQIIFTLAAMVGIHFFILKEEGFLAKIHGENYLAYRKRVRRYL